MPPQIFIEARAWRRCVPGAERLARRAATAAGGAASILLTTDRAVQRLNAHHRGRNKPTNVLSFDALPGMAGGDLVLALGTLRREAALAEKPLAHHLAHLVVHGTLHLRGHDHAHPGEARRMEMLESRILHRLGIPNPWRHR